MTRVNIHFTIPQKVELFLSDIETPAIACLAVTKPETVKVMRHGKWGVEKKEYDKDTYPAYCLGPAIGFNKRGAQVTLETAAQTETYKLDDVFISGILRYKSRLPLLRYKAVTFTRS